MPGYRVGLSICASDFLHLEFGISGLGELNHNAGFDEEHQRIIGRSYPDLRFGITIVLGNEIKQVETIRVLVLFGLAVLTPVLTRNVVAVWIDALDALASEFRRSA